MFSRTIALATAIAAVAAASVAQQPAAFSVRLEKSDQNPTGCTALDPAMSRQHTVTIVGNTAVVKSAGGIDDVAKQTTPGVYKTKFAISGATLDIVVDTTSSPRTLTATAPRMGCKWTGAAA